MKKLTLIGLILIANLIMQAQDNKPEIIGVDDKAPTFAIQTIDAEMFNTDSLEGKVIYLNFFATWCGPCMKEMPHIESDIWKTIKNDHFVMLCIAREQTAEVISKFKLEKEYTMPMAADIDRKVYSLFANQTIPRNIVINKKGKIIYSSTGYNPDSFNAMVELIKSALQ